MNSPPTPPFASMSDDQLAALLDAPAAPLVPPVHRGAVIETLRGLRGHAATLAGALAAGGDVTGFDNGPFVP